MTCNFQHPPNENGHEVGGMRSACKNLLRKCVTEFLGFFFLEKKEVIIYLKYMFLQTLHTVLLFYFVYLQLSIYTYILPMYNVSMQVD